jgi:hypothetical protein
MLTYEHKLNQDSNWALMEGSMYFEERSAVHETLRSLVKILNELGVDYAVVGGMAMFIHGYRRFTEDVDVLVTREGLAQIHEALEGRGYVKPFAASKNLRDASTGVKIDFLISGQYPGDGKPGPISFPEPREAAIARDQAKVISIEKLVELKLASGQIPGRRKDLGDVQELIRLLKLPREFADQLDGSVQDLYKELWSELNASPTEE